MQTVSNFLAMGGYAAFVWPAFGATALVLGALLLASLRALHAAETTLAALQGRGRASEITGAGEVRDPVQKVAREA